MTASRTQIGRTVSEYLNPIARLSSRALVLLSPQMVILLGQIKQLTLTARTLLVHAQSHWPEYITTMLWPIAFKAVQDRMGELNFGIDGKTPDMRFSGVGVKSLRLRDFHTFGCPCYVLDSRLQTDPKRVPKREPRARVGGWRVKPSFFLLAFPQAGLDVPVCMELPLGMEIPGAAYKRQHVLLLKKNLYGLKQAANSWYDMLKKGLKLRGFSESVADPCIFIKSSAAAQPSTKIPAKLPTRSTVLGSRVTLLLYCLFGVN